MLKIHPFWVQFYSLLPNEINSVCLSETSLIKPLYRPEISLLHWGLLLSFPQNLFRFWIYIKRATIETRCHASCCSVNIQRNVVSYTFSKLYYLIGQEDDLFFHSFNILSPLNLCIFCRFDFLLGICLRDQAEFHICGFVYLFVCWFSGSVLPWAIKWKYMSRIFLTGLNTSASVSKKES